MSQPFGISCKGGLNTNLNQLELLAQPGLARVLRNFEVDPDGGYRRINGYAPYGTTRPAGDLPILGVVPYALGVVVCVGTNIYYTDNGTNWIQINKNTGSMGVTEAVLATSTVLPRVNQGQAQFVIMESPTGHSTSSYGSLSIATGPNQLAHFHIDGIGASRLFIYEEVSTPAAAKYLALQSRHLCLVDAVNAPSTVYYSRLNDDRDFTGVGAGAIAINDRIVGIKSFRDSLYIFGKNTIHRLDNVDDPSNIKIVLVTNNVGCLSGYSIQEIGGDLVFLAPDGIRTVAGTERIGDVELSSVSRQIQSIIGDLASSIDSYIITSAVLRSKSQYRLFYSSPLAINSASYGIIGTLTANGFEWSETLGIQAHAFASGYDGIGVEQSYHGDKNGYIFNHNIGNSFNSSNIEAVYQTPDYDFGDIGTRKTLKYARLSFSPEGTVQPKLRVRYDYEDTEIIQPEEYILSTIPTPSLFGTAVFGVSILGATNDPMVRQTIEGSGNTCSFKITSNDQLAPYAINGFYIDYVPAGRR
jgi:hypothetical protein